MICIFINHKVTRKHFTWKNISEFWMWGMNPAITLLYYTLKHFILEHFLYVFYFRTIWTRRTTLNTTIYYTRFYLFKSLLLFLYRNNVLSALLLLVFIFQNNVFKILIELYFTFSIWKEKNSQCIGKTFKRNIIIRWNERNIHIANSINRKSREKKQLLIE